MTLEPVFNFITDGVNGIIGGITNWCCGAVGLGAVIIGATIFLYLKKRKSRHDNLR